MDFIHSRENLNHGDIVVVKCSHQCNIMLLDDSNFSNYQSGGQFHYHGGFFKMFPAKIAVPSSGWWNIVIDLAGGTANIQYSINVLKR